MSRNSAALYIVILCQAILLTMLPLQTAQAAPKLGMPIACTLGKDCWVAGYMDTDARQGQARDYSCGANTFDGNKGTNFAVRDLIAVQKGIPVLAAANGRVIKVRDGMDDALLTRAEIDKMNEEKRGCGNGLFVDHGNGWGTIYCHLRKGSITLKKGQKVTAGEKLGLVGASGAIAFPHLHFGVFFESSAIDPFTGKNENVGCGLKNVNKTALWDKETNQALPYEPLSIYAMGFDDHIPDFQQAKIDTTSKKDLQETAKDLVFWAGLYGLKKKGDRIALDITDPLGRVYVRRSQVVDNDQMRQFFYIGKRTGVRFLLNGMYVGTITVERDMPDHSVFRRSGSQKILIK